MSNNHLLSKYLTVNHLSLTFITDCSFSYCLCCFAFTIFSTIEMSHCILTMIYCLKLSACFPSPSHRSFFLIMPLFLPFSPTHALEVIISQPRHLISTPSGLKFRLMFIILLDLSYYYLPKIQLEVHIHWKK